VLVPVSKQSDSDFIPGLGFFRQIFRQLTAQLAAILAVSSRWIVTDLRCCVEYCPPSFSPLLLRLPFIGG
jgi:hypothetical protein